MAAEGKLRDASDDAAEHLYVVVHDTVVAALAPVAPARPGSPTVVTIAPPATGWSLPHNRTKPSEYGGRGTVSRPSGGV